METPASPQPLPLQPQTALSPGELINPQETSSPNATTPTEPPLPTPPPTKKPEEPELPEIEDHDIFLQFSLSIRVNGEKTIRITGSQHMPLLLAEEMHADAKGNFEQQMEVNMVRPAKVAFQRLLMRHVTKAIENNERLALPYARP